MVTDEDRAFARRQSRLIYENHVRNGGSGFYANHIAANLPYEESLRRGLLGECAFVHEFGIVGIDGGIRDKGDGGRDFRLPLRISPGTDIRYFDVDVKTKSVRRKWEGLRRYGTHLRVPVKVCSPDTIYVFAIYLERMDEAEVLRWDWGRTLMNADERDVFSNSNGEMSYVRRFEDLRDLQELKDRLRVREDLFE